MKNLLLFASLLLVGSCVAPVTSMFETTLALQVKSSARTLEASLPAVDHYAATLTAEDGTTIAVDPVDAAKPTPLTTGAWSVVVRALDQAGAQIGEGTATIDVISGSNSLPVVVNPLRKATGTFHITLDYSEGADHLVFLLYPWSSATPDSLPVDAVSVSLTSAVVPTTLVADSSFLQGATYTLDLAAHRAVFEGQLKSQDYLLQVSTMMSTQTSGIYAEILRMFDQGKVVQTLTRPSFVVTFDSNGGSGSMSPQPFAFGLMGSLDTNSFGAPVGHAFVGWNTTVDGTGISYSEGQSFSQGLDQNLTLYAQWAPVYRVLFAAHGGSGSLAPLSLAAGTSSTLPSSTGISPPSSAPQSYFTSWNTQADGLGTTYGDGVKFDMPANATGDITLFAQWTYRYQLLFDSNGGTGFLAGQVMVVGDTKTLPLMGTSMVGPVGATVFNGWTTATDGSGTHYNDQDSFTMPANATADVTLYARWGAVPLYSVTVVSSNGTYGSAVVSEGAGPFAVGTVVHLVATPSPGNYSFVNWSGNISGVLNVQSASTTLTVPSSPVALTANFSVPVSGTLSSGHTSLARGVTFNADVYSFTVSGAGQDISISMIGHPNDSFLYLYQGTWSGTPLQFNDDGGGSLDALIQIYLAPGVYFVEATSYTANKNFPYSLSASSSQNEAVTLSSY